MKFLPHSPLKMRDGIIKAQSLSPCGKFSTGINEKLDLMFLILLANQISLTNNGLGDEGMMEGCLRTSPVCGSTKPAHINALFLTLTP